MIIIATVILTVDISHLISEQLSTATDPSYFLARSIWLTCLNFFLKQLVKEFFSQTTCKIIF